jgi:hypothetical protein
VRERRKSQRFELTLPLELIRNGSKRVSVMCETKNLSSLGVLFQTSRGVKLGPQVEYLITLPIRHQADAVRLHCVGRIIRRANDTEFAATLERHEFIRSGT